MTGRRIDISQKESSIADLLALLDLSARGWEIVDHWDADRCAIGICKRGATRHLVYVSCWKQDPGRYYYECELPTGPMPEDFTVVREAKSATIAELMQALAAHLR